MRQQRTSCRSPVQPTPYPEQARNRCRRNRWKLFWARMSIDLDQQEDNPGSLFQVCIQFPSYSEGHTIHHRICGWHFEPSTSYSCCYIASCHWIFPYQRPWFPAKDSTSWRRVHICRGINLAFFRPSLPFALEELHGNSLYGVLRNTTTFYQLVKE